MGDRVIGFEIGCDDQKAASAFYERVFGWKTTDYGPNGRRVDTGAEGGIHGHIVSLDDWPNALRVYIEVEDLGAKIGAVEAAGGEAVLGPLPTPDGQRFAWVKDVAGNIIGLLEARG
jgi:predicted enzyme related to lactoylglutathione lyase